MRVIAGTNNKHKMEEFEKILQPFNVELIPLSEIGDFEDIEETGKTFEENARIKALAFAKFAASALKNGIPPVIADDSGLEVDALGGRPGIYSARYAENNDARIRKVLQEMTGVNNRTARFVCAIAIAAPSGIIAQVRGEVEGKIGFAPKGSAGFGYDPIFYPDGYDLTFAELGSEIKNGISHRSRALRKAGESLGIYFATGKSP